MTTLQAASLVSALLTASGTMLGAAIAVIRKVAQREQSVDHAITDLTKTLQNHIAGQQQHNEGQHVLATSIARLSTAVEGMDDRVVDHESRLRRLERGHADKETER